MSGQAAFLRLRRAALRALLLLAPLLLSACLSGAPLATIHEQSNDAGDIELVLDPIDVWDDEGAGAPEEITFNDSVFYVRVRPKDPLNAFEQAWVRLGLFWHSRQDRIHMPIVIAGGSPVEIKKVQVEAGGTRAVLKKAKNFSFTPGKRPFDRNLSSGVFTLKPKTLSKFAGAENVYVTINTNRGALRANLSVVRGKTDEALAASAKYQFADFYKRQQARQ